MTPPRAPLVSLRDVRGTTDTCLAPVVPVINVSRDHRGPTIVSGSIKRSGPDVDDRSSVSRSGPFHGGGGTEAQGTPPGERHCSGTPPGATRAGIAELAN